MLDDEIKWQERVFALRDVPAEQRDTESAIRLWHQNASGIGEVPALSAFDFSRLTSDWGYRFLISGDAFVEASVFLVYGVHFARLLGLSERPQSKMPFLNQLPERYRPVFVDGYCEAFRNLAPMCLTGTVPHQLKLELYRAAFMPIRGTNSVRPLIYGTFNYRVVRRETAIERVRMPTRAPEADSVTDGPRMV
jgi:hypothetical protein